MRQLYLRFRRWLARWIPDPVSGVGFSGGGMDSGELALELNVEGRTGTVYLSREMWLALGAQAGWEPQAPALEALANAWERDPHQRLGQLLLNVSRRDGMTDKQALWNMRDSEITRRLEEWQT